MTTSAAAFQAKFLDFRLGDDGRPPVAAPVDQRTFAAKPPADWKGPQWVPTVDKMKTPSKPATGWVMGGGIQAGRCDAESERRNPNAPAGQAGRLRRGSSPSNSAGRNHWRTSKGRSWLSPRKQMKP